MCIQNGEDDIDLIVGKIYRVLKSKRNDRSLDVRVVDESGKDYLFPRAWFVPVELPWKAKQALTAAH